MKNVLNKLNKVFENRIRLGIMSALMVNDRIDFLSLKQLLEVTDGNLAGHLQALEKARYLQVRKTFIGRKTKTSYSATSAGHKAFNLHLTALEKLVKEAKK